MRNDASNREFASTVFVHEGEYWAFDRELVHREKGGGYGVPLAMHSKDGETWVHGVPGPRETKSCNSQGCYLWDGAVEVLYGEHEQFWALPQDGSLTGKWAIAGSKGCTISGPLKCGPAVVTDKPAERPEVPGGIIHIEVSNGHFAEGCLECQVDSIAPDGSAPPSMHPVQASLSVHRDGTVANVSVNYPSSKRISSLIADQLSKWLFEPAHNGPNTIEIKKDVSMFLMCAGFPGRPETDRCTLHPSDQFSKR
jgi:hypothetical protein